MVHAFAVCAPGKFAVDSECIESKFQVITESMDANTIFSFYLSAKGTFYIDWGDGDTETISRANNTSPTKYSHVYDNAGSVTIQFGGQATGYNSGTVVAAIRFYGGTPELVSSVSGNLSAIFPSFGSRNSESPKFKTAFQDCVHLTSLPETLFSEYTIGVTGMFEQLCYGCTSLTDISPDLFGNITTGASTMFSEAFRDCTALTTIPPTLFSRITSGGNNMFYGTFNGCSSLSVLPPGLFSGITATSPYLFARTFYDCTSLSGYIPASLFSGLIANSSPNGSSLMAGIFTNTHLDTECPPETTLVTTGYESYWEGYVACQQTSYNCSAGYYFSAGVGGCVICPGDSYCPGGVYNVSSTQDQGVNTCPGDYTYDTTTGKSDITQCQIYCSAGTYIDTGYTELEYLESEGIQYIDTDFIPNKQSRMVIDFYVNRPEKPWIAYVGNTTAFGIIQSTNTASTSFLVYNGSNSDSSGFWRVGDIYGNGIGRYTVDINKNNVNITAEDGSMVSNTFTYGPDYELTTPLYLFGGDRNGALMQSDGAKIKIYSVKLYDNDELVRDFVPVRRNSDGTLGMYDRVSETLFENVGNGNFNSGPEVGVIGGKCTNVGAGYWAPESVINYGSGSSRNICDVGTYSNIENAGSCTACVGATYNDVQGATSCNACPNGYDYNMNSGKTSITQCQIYCPPGTWNGEYNQLEYLESEGIQYIDTDFIPNKQSRMVIDFYVNRPEKPWIAYVGNTTAFGIIQSTNTASTSFLVYNGSNSDSSGFWRVGDIYGNGIGRYTVDINKNNVNITAEDGSMVSNTFTYGPDYELTTPLYLFGGDRNGALMQSDGAKIKIYSVKLYDNDELVRDFVPVRRNSDGTLGMYDRVSETLFENVGNGNFNSGPEIGVIGGGLCIDVGVGYYVGASTTDYGSIVTRTACPAGTFTVGYGHGADEENDCGRILHLGNSIIYARRNKPTIPALNIYMENGDMYYIGLSTTDHNVSRLHFRHGDTEYTAFDDSLLYGERDYDTGQKK